jgi:hypothetical protein
MSISIKNQETDRLVRELAEIRGISLVDAVHEAVQQKLLHELRNGSPLYAQAPNEELHCNEPEHVGPQSPHVHNSLIDAIDERRLLIARYNGMDRAIDALLEDVVAPMLLFLLFLLAAPYFEDRLATAVVVATLAGAGLLIVYGRSLLNEKKSRSQWRQSVTNEIKALCTALPPELTFMRRIPNTGTRHLVAERSMPQTHRLSEPEPAADAAQ